MKCVGCNGTGKRFDYGWKNGGFTARKVRCWRCGGTGVAK